MDAQNDEASWSSSDVEEPKVTIDHQTQVCCVRMPFHAISSFIALLL